MLPCCGVSQLSYSVLWERAWIQLESLNVHTHSLLSSSSFRNPFGFYPLQTSQCKPSAHRGHYFYLVLQQHLVFPQMVSHPSTNLEPLLLDFSDLTGTDRCNVASAIIGSDHCFFTCHPFVRSFVCRCVSTFQTNNKFQVKTMLAPG